MPIASTSRLFSASLRLARLGSAALGLAAAGWLLAATGPIPRLDNVSAADYRPPARPDRTPADTPKLKFPL